MTRSQGGGARELRRARELSAGVGSRELSREGAGRGVGAGRGNVERRKEERLEGDEGLVRELARELRRWLGADQEPGS